ncbi:hypothetical protein CEXT_772961, partial [Caerostris extrusa]
MFGLVTLLNGNNKRFLESCTSVSSNKSDNTPIWDIDVGVGGLEMIDQSFWIDGMILMTF